MRLFVNNCAALLVSFNLYHLLYSYDDFLELHNSFDTILLMHDCRTNALCGATVYSVIPTSLKMKSKSISIIRVSPFNIPFVHMLLFYRQGQHMFVLNIKE